MRSFLGVAAATALVAAVACGGSTFSTGSDAGADGHGGSGSSSGSASSSGGSSGSGGGSGSGSGSGGGGPPCPASPPSPGPCMPDGVECEYGSNPNPSCNALWGCSNGRWTPGAAPACPVGVCPVDYKTAMQLGACQPAGFDCAYHDGQCDCSFSGPGGTQNMPTWHCFSPSGCPEPRPRLGEACSREGQSCDYGACSGGVAMTCMGGYWQQQGVACPG